MDDVVRERLRQILGDEVASSGLREEIRQILAALYADVGLIQSRDPVFLQSSFDILIGLFVRVRLWTNTTNKDQDNGLCSWKKIAHKSAIMCATICMNGLLIAQQVSWFSPATRALKTHRFRSTS